MWWGRRATTTFSMTSPEPAGNATPVKAIAGKAVPMMRSPPTELLAMARLPLEMDGGVAADLMVVVVWKTP
jgi:hypothetical protein